MKADIKKAIENRRSFYAISNHTTIQDKELEEMIQFAIKHTPSAFNSQSARAVLLLGEHHLKLWGIVADALRKKMSEKAFESTEMKLNAFAAGYGTILFFEDQAIIEGLQNQFPSYSQTFPIWSQQSAGMHQYVLWMLIEDAGMGASLQHYNPIIDDEVRQTWNLPSTWKLVAQMPFGKPTAQPGEKSFNPIDERVLVFK